MIHFWMILRMLLNHPKLDDLYRPLLDDSEHAHYPKLDDLYGSLMNDNASSNNNTGQSTIDLLRETVVVSFSVMDRRISFAT